MWEKEDKYKEREYHKITPSSFESGRESRRRIRKENRKVKKTKY